MTAQKQRRIAVVYLSALAMACAPAANKSPIPLEQQQPEPLLGDRGKGSICGNGVVEAEEQCDDGNDSDRDCCSIKCRAINENRKCNDGLFCTDRDACSSGVCQGTLDTCDDDLRCTIDSCDEEEQQCLHYTTEKSCPEPGDRDEDGVVDSQDRCLDSPSVRALVDGCSALDLVTRPEAVFEPLLEQYYSATQPILRRDAELHALLQNLGEQLSTSQRLLTMAKIEEAVNRYQETVDQLKSKVLSKRIGNSLSLQGQYDIADGDVSDPDIIGAFLQLQRQTIDQAIAEVDRVGQDLRRLLDTTTGPRVVEGRIDTIDNATGIIRVGETLVGLAEIPEMAAQDIALRKLVVLDGVGFSDGTLAAGGLVAEQSEMELDYLPMVCLDLQVAPVQYFTGYPYLTQFSDLVVLPRAGFTKPYPQTLQLEHGARLAGRENPDCAAEGTRHSLLLLLKYLRLNPGAAPSWHTTTLSASLGDQELSQGLPTDMASPDAILVVTAQTQTCAGSLCAFTTGGSVELAVQIHPKNYYCDAVYQDTEFQLEDFYFAIGDTTPFPQFAAAKVTHVDSRIQQDNGSNILFVAEAFAIDNGISSYPSTQLVGDGAPFAIYQHFDFVWDELFHSISAGVEVAAGVRWPRMVGMRNQNFFQYSCGIPELIRDQVDACPSESDNSYYRLPFYPTNDWDLGASNHDDPYGWSHCCLQQFAYDFGNSEGAEIRAARGGIVRLKKETAIGNDWDCYRGLDACFETHCLGGPLDGDACEFDLDCNPGICYQPSYCVGDPTQECTGNSQCSSNSCSYDCFSLWPCDNGNYVFVEHQDGSFGVYWHFRHNTITVEVGDRVYRGDTLGQNGNTGNSSDPHLHFHVQPTGLIDDSVSVPVFFELDGSSCVRPHSQSATPSTNCRQLEENCPIRNAM